MSTKLRNEPYNGEPLQVSTTHHSDGTFSASVHPMQKAPAPQPPKEEPKPATTHNRPRKP